MDQLGVSMSELAEVCHRYGIARIEVFGSAARGEASEASDIDLLYELVPGARLRWDIEELTCELTRLFGRPVDLVSRRALHPMLRSHVLAEARPLCTWTRYSWQGSL